MPSIFDVAREAGVSITAVSMVLNNPETRHVREAKRQEILRVAKALGYTPNLLAKGLRNHGTRILGLIVPMRDPIFFNLFIAEVLSGIQSWLLQKGYHLIVYSHSGKKGKVTRSQIVESKCLDGVIFINTRLCTAADIRASAKDLQSAKIPFVMLNSYYGPTSFNYVGVDDYEIGYKVAQYLCERGHRRIALLAGSQKSPAHTHQLKGFEQALAEHDVPFGERWVAFGDYDKEIIHRTVRRWLKAKDRPTAIFCASDQMVMDLYRVLQAEQVKIPADVAVVGRGDLMFASILTPPLTTIRIPLFDLGYKAAQLLIDSLKAPNQPPQKILLPCELIQRASA